MTLKICRTLWLFVLVSVSWHSFTYAKVDASTILLQEKQFILSNSTKFSRFDRAVDGIARNRRKRATQITIVRINVKNMAESISPIAISCHDRNYDVLEADDLLNYGDEMRFTIFDIIITIKYTCDIRLNRNGTKHTFTCYDGVKGFRGGQFEIRDTGVVQFKARKPAEEILSFSN